MSNKKITELGALTTPAGADQFAIVDDTDATTKRVTVTALMTQAPQGDLEAANNLSDLNNAASARTNLGLGTAATSASTDFSPAFFSIVAETTTARTLSDSDNGKVIACSNSGQSIVTIPSGLTAGFSCTIVQSGTGTVSVIGSGGAVVSGLSNKTATAGQYAALNVIPVGTNAYILDGDGITAPLVNNNSVDLDGTNQYIDTAAALTLQSASVWIKPDSTVNASSGTQVILGFPSFDRFSIGNVTSYLTNESIGIAYGSGAFGTGNVSITNTAFTHIFFAWQTSSQSNGGSAGYDFWVNGTLQTSGSGAQSGGSPSSSPLTITSLDVGRRQDNSQFYAGLIDEVALWSADVSGDIATIYNSGKPDDLSSSSVVSTAPINWYRMGDNDGGTGTTITDQGSSPADGTLINGPTFSSDVP